MECFLPTCQNTRQEGKRLLRCSRCHHAFYCSKECQLAHWKVHKKQCKAPNSVLIVNTSNAARGILAQIMEQEQSPLEMRSTNIPDTTSCIYPVTTKYYSALLDFRLWSGPVDAKESERRAATENAQALILVFDSTNPDSFAEMCAWGPVMNDTSANVRLVVGKQMSEQVTDLDGKARNWAIDHNAEYVHSPFVDDLVVEPPGIRPLADEVGKDGVSRVVEALQSNFWNSIHSALKGSTPTGNRKANGSKKATSKKTRSGYGAVSNTTAPAPKKEQQEVEKKAEKEAPQMEFDLSGLVDAEPSSFAEPPSDTNHVLLVGAAGAGKKFVLNKILGEAKLQPSSVEGLQSCCWDIKNKYYSATLEFLLVAPDASEELRATLGETCQAVILLYDHSSEQAFEALQGWASFLEAVDPEIQLLVANEVKDVAEVDEKQQQAFRDRADEWSIDVNIEFVEIKYNDVVGRSDPRMGDEKKGTARVAEALESTMWNNMTRAGGQPSLPSFGVDGGFEFDGMQARERVYQEHEKKKEQEEFEAEMAQKEKELRAQRRKEKAREDTVEVPEPQTEKSVDELDQEDRAFQAMIQQVRAVAENSSNLSDHDRRAKASEVALRMLAQFGISDGSDSD